LELSSPYARGNLVRENPLRVGTIQPTFRGIELNVVNIK
jgi:hypothetical protein